MISFILKCFHLKTYDDESKMPFIIFRIILFLTFPGLIFGQSEKPQTILVPSGSLGEISEVKVKILEKTLESKLDEYFDIVPRHLFEEAQEKAFEELDYEECTEEQCIMMIQEMLQIENAFQLTLLSVEEDTQLSLTWTDLDKKRVEEVFCEGCKIKELRSSIEVLIDKLVKESMDPEEILRRKQEEEKKERIESAYSIALENNSIDSFEDFIDEYKDESLAETFVLSSLKYIKIIKDELENKKRENEIEKIESAYNRALEKNSIDSLEDFISEYDDQELAKNYISLSKEIIDQKKLDILKNKIEKSFEGAVQKNNSVSYENFIIEYKDNIHAKSFVSEAKNKIILLNKSKAEKSFLTNYEEVMTKNDKNAFIKFINKYEDLNVNQDNINNIKYLIDTHPNKNYENYLYINSENRETVGCGFLDFNCPDPIKLPTFNKKFDVINYKRIKVNGNKYPWINSKIFIKKRVNLLIFASGGVVICKKCSLKGEQPPEKLLTYKIGQNNTNYFKFRKNFNYSKNNMSIMSTSTYEEGEIHFTIKDWRTYPPPTDWYKDNSGFFLIDVFVWDQNKKENFLFFLEEVKILNKDDQTLLDQIDQFLKINKN